MRELLRTNDPVLLSFVESLLRDAGVTAVIADQNMSVLEGSIGVLPRRVLVDTDDIEHARSVLIQSDLGGWLSDAGSA